MQKLFVVLFFLYADMIFFRRYSVQSEWVLPTRFLFLTRFCIMKNRSRFLFIFNPAADKGRAVRKAEWLKTLLAGRSDAVVMTTRYAGHAGDIARAEVGSYSTMVACGGDGTLHEVVNAITGKSIRVGIVPIGSANDFVKTLYAGRPAPAGIEHFFSAASKGIDLGSIVYGDGEHRFMINSLGIGFTGQIAQIVQQTRWLKGELLYVYALLTVLFRYKPLVMRLKITLADSVLELCEPIFAFSVANGKIEGGKFQLAPSADLSDGLLDLCILKAIPKRKMLRYVVKYLRGTQVSDPQVLSCKVKAVEVMLERADVMHIDGEVFDHVGGHLAISVVPQGISVLR
jgi:diacylglycerol kinase (ATP)